MYSKKNPSGDTCRGEKSTLKVFKTKIVVVESGNYRVGESGRKGGKALSRL
jgi:hypothetical protein